MKIKDGDFIQIGELANMLGITTRTIRYYEEISLMEPPRRLDGGTRVYDKEDIRNLKFILKLKELGITLKEMQELSKIYKMHKSSLKVMPRLLEILDTHISSVDEKISRISSLRKEIIEYRHKIVDLMKKPEIQ